MQCFAADGNQPVSVALDALATRLGAGLVLSDASGRLVFANRRALELLGCQGGGESVSLRWSELQTAMPPVAAGHVVPFTLEVPAGQVSRELRGQRRLLADSVVETLLSDRRSLGELDLELLCASRMKEWTHQSESLVHDANGALNTIQLTLELLDGQWPGPSAGEQAREPNRRNHVSVIRENLEKLKFGLRQLVAAHEEPPAAAYDLRDLIKEATATLKMPARRKRVELQVGAMEGALPVQGNRSRLRQALVNVALARIAAVPERGRLEIAAGPAANGSIVLSCTDNGSLSADALVGIYQLLLAEGGAGSEVDALRLSRAIVESEGGEFDVEPFEGGTRLRFLLPALRA